MKERGPEETEDLLFWRRKTGQERLAALEEMRRRMWGAACDGSIQRVVHIREFSDEILDDFCSAPLPGDESPG